MASILSEVNLDNLSTDDLKAHLAKTLQAKAKQREHQKEYNATPEAKEARKAYQTKRQAEIATDPEKAAALKTKREEYNQRPEVVAKRKEYHKKRNASMKALLAEAAKRGLKVKADGTIEQTEPAASA